MLKKTKMLTSVLAIAGLVLALAPATQAATIIGDAYGGGTGLDDGTNNKDRLNINWTPVSLTADTYTVFLATAATSGDGNVIPLLFKRNLNNNGFVVLWSGGNQAVTGTSPSIRKTFNFTDQIVLSETTNVYAGMYQDSNAQVYFFDGSGAGLDAHDADDNPTSYTAGDIFLDTSFSDLNIARTYSFAVAVIPEPATMSLLALGAMALLRRRRRA